MLLPNENPNPWPPPAEPTRKPDLDYGDDTDRDEEDTGDTKEDENQ